MPWVSFSCNEFKSIIESPDEVYARGYKPVEETKETAQDEVESEAEVSAIKKETRQ